MMNARVFRGFAVPSPFLLLLVPAVFFSPPSLLAQGLEKLEAHFLEGARKGCRACVRVDVMRAARPGARGKDRASSLPVPEGLVSVSGILLTENGEVATVGEALEDAERVWVEVGDSGEARRFKAVVLGVSREVDVGVVRILSGGPFRPLPLGDSDRLRAGALVMCAAYTLGLDAPPSFNVGVVNAVGRPFRTTAAEGKGISIPFIQTSLPLHPGETGGPVLDTSCRVVGMLFSPCPVPSLGGEGSGRGAEEGGGGTFSAGRWGSYTLVVPINRLKREVDAIIERGERVRVSAEKARKRAERPWLGLQAREITDETLRFQLHLSEGGVLVSYVFPGDPAARAGIRKNDILKSWNHTAIRGLDHLGELVRGTRVGDRVTLEVLRGGEKMDLEVVIGGF